MKFKNLGQACYAMLLTAGIAGSSCSEMTFELPQGPKGDSGQSAYALWLEEVNSGRIHWEKSKTAMVDFFMYLKGEHGATGKSAYEQWVEFISSGDVDDPHTKGSKWSINRNSLADFYAYLTGATGSDGQTPHIGSDGNWWIGTINTRAKAEAQTISIGANGNWFINGIDTGKPSRGADGRTPLIAIGDNGNWFIDGVDTGKKSRTEIHIGANGNIYIDGVDTGRPSRGADGRSPLITIGENGNWLVDGIDTGRPSRGRDGSNGFNGQDGHTPIITIGDNGHIFIDGKDTGKKVRADISIGSNGNWFINGLDTGHRATGQPALPPTITIGANGNWFVDGVDTGKPSRGAKGANGQDGHTPTITIGDNGNIFVDGVDTGKKSRSEVSIGENGNWWIDGRDTGRKAYATDGARGTDGTDGTNGKDGASAYQLWKQDLAEKCGTNAALRGTDNKPWDCSKNSLADFWKFLQGQSAPAATTDNTSPKPAANEPQSGTIAGSEYRVYTTTTEHYDGVDYVVGGEGYSYTAEGHISLQATNAGGYFLEQIALIEYQVDNSARQKKQVSLEDRRTITQGLLLYSTDIGGGRWNTDTDANDNLERREELLKPIYNPVFRMKITYLNGAVRKTSNWID